MRIWLINPYALPPDGAGIQRHGSLGRELVKRGHSVTVVAGNFDHFRGAFHSLDGESRGGRGKEPMEIDRDGLRFRFLPVPAYRGNGLGRFRNMLSFARRVLGLHPKRSEIPDVIVGSSLHLLGAAAARRVARRWGAAFVLEIRDLWPETLTDLLGMGRWHPFVFLNRVLADSLYRHSSEIVTTLPLAEPHFRERGAPASSRVTWIPNGCDPGVREVDADESGSRKQDPPFTVAYAGSIGTANAVGELIEACRIWKRRWGDGSGKDRFRVEIMGDGPSREALQRRAENEGLDFVSFLGRLTRTEVRERLCKSDVGVLMIRPSPIYRWGYSMNKLADYLAAGLPVVGADVSPYRPVEEAGCGALYEPGEPESLAEAIESLRTTSREGRSSMGRRARAYAAERFDWEKLGARLEEVLDRAVRERS